MSIESVIQWALRLFPAVRKFEAETGRPFFRIVKDTDPDAPYYLPELRRDRH